MGTLDKNAQQNAGNVGGQGTQGTQGMQGSQGTTGDIGSPISNEAYNVITALQAKLEGMEAYRKYSKDGSSQIWQQLTQAEMQGVGVLVGELERLVKDGKFRTAKTGNGNRQS